MSKRQAFASVGFFLFVCGCGAFAAAAGGIEWGTADCGLTAFGTLAFGLIMAPVAGMAFGE